jgi:thioredoxin 1
MSCIPSRIVGPVVENLAEANQGKIRVAKINVDENQALAMQYGIRSIPTLSFFKGGEEVKRIVGAQGKAQLQKVIDEVIG